jgi:hypothetical protein
MRQLLRRYALGRELPYQPHQARSQVIEIGDFTLRELANEETAVRMCLEQPRLHERSAGFTYRPAADAQPRGERKLVHARAHFQLGIENQALDFGLANRDQRLGASRLYGLLC